MYGTTREASFTAGIWIWEVLFQPFQHSAGLERTFFIAFFHHVRRVAGAPGTPLIRTDRRLRGGRERCSDLSGVLSDELSAGAAATATSLPHQMARIGLKLAVHRGSSAAATEGTDAVSSSRGSATTANGPAPNDIRCGCPPCSTD
jgi:hypothetical protein